MFNENSVLTVLVIVLIAVSIFGLVGYLLKRRAAAMALQPLVDPAVNSRPQPPTQVNWSSGSESDPLITEALGKRDSVSDQIKKAIELMLAEKDYAGEVERIIRFSIGDVPLTIEAVKAAIPENAIGSVGLFYSGNERMVIRINHSKVHEGDRHNLIIQLSIGFNNNALTIDVGVSGLTIIDQLEHFNLTIIGFVLDIIIKASPYYFQGKGHGTVLYPCRLNSRETINELSKLYSLSGLMRQGELAVTKVLEIFRSHDPENLMRYSCGENKTFTILTGTEISPHPEYDIKAGPSYASIFDAYNPIEKNFDCGREGLNRIVIERAIEKLVATLSTIDMTGLASIISLEVKQSLSVKDRYIDVVLGEYKKEDRLLVKPNRVNTYYEEESLKSSVARLKERGSIISEMGTPLRTEGMSNATFFERCSYVEVSQAGAIIDARTIKFESTPEKVIITAKAKMLTDLKGFKFGMRGFNKTDMHGDKVVEHMTSIVTWDLIPEDESSK